MKKSCIYTDLHDDEFVEEFDIFISVEFKDYVLSIHTLLFIELHNNTVPSEVPSEWNF